MEARHRFTLELNNLKQLILKMGALVEESLGKAITALARRDSELAQAVIEGDSVIDDLQNQIEDNCTRLIATEQPVAGDLRAILTSVKLCSDLERIGDHARHLARAVEQIPGSVMAVALPKIRRMAELGQSMVHDSLTAFVEQSADGAMAVAARDEEIDHAHQELYAEIVTMMKQHPEQIDAGISLMFLNRFLERLGDHVTNMCEWVIYANRGEHIELNR